MRGSDCPGATQVNPGGQVGGVLMPLGTLAVTSSGAWTQTFKVGEQFVGSGSVTATCDEDGPLGRPGALEVSYPSVSVTVTTR